MTKKPDRMNRIKDADDFYFLNRTEEWSRDPRASQRAFPDAGDAALLGRDATAAWDEDEIGDEGMGALIIILDQDLIEQLNEVFGLTDEDDNELFGLVERSKWRDAHLWN